jgi:hypothetical protein
VVETPMASIAWGPRLGRLRHSLRFSLVA